MSTIARQTIEPDEADRMYDAIMVILMDPALRSATREADRRAFGQMIDAVKWTAMRRLPDDELRALRQQAGDLLYEDLAGTGEGIGSSDINHVAVGILALRFWTDLPNPLQFTGDPFATVETDE